MTDFLATLLQAVLTVATPIIASFLAMWLRAAIVHLSSSTSNALAARYLSEVAEAAAIAVLYVSQTYVDAIKEEGKWNTATQKEALRQAIEKAKALLSEDALDFVKMIYGDIEAYLSSLIEASVKANKMEAQRNI